MSRGGDPGARGRLPRWGPWTGAALLVAAGVVLVVVRGRSPEPRVASEPLVTGASIDSNAPDVRFEDFVGSAACAECHEENYEAWAASTHGTAGGEPGPETVIAPFDGTPIRFADAVAIPRRDAVKGYFFVVRWHDRPPDTLRVDGVVGRGHMVGGGTQGFFTAMPDGTRRFIPFDWSRTEGRWFCIVRWPRPGEWRAIDEELSLAQCADWTPRRVMGSLDRFANCQQCHGSQILATFDADDRSYHTRYTTLRVNCESCHGPGREHVELARSGRIAATADIGLRSLDGVLSKDRSLDVCLRCHATKRVLRPGDLPGEPLERNFSLFLPLLTDRTLHPDGRIRGFGYQLNHLASDCYLNGSMTCVSCHDPHSQAYRDEQYRPLEGRFDDGQCTSCHAAKASSPEAHTFHAPGSEGSSCVGCHMPYLQQPSLGSEIRYARSDHTIPVPRPASDEAEGVTNACSLCHRDRSVSELQDSVNAWYGTLKPRKSLVRAMLEDRPADGREAAARELLRPGDAFPMAQYMALSRFVIAYLKPDMTSLDATTSRALMELSESPDLDVRALALAAHHLARGESPAVRELLQEALQGPDGALLAARWTRSLSYLAEVYSFRGSPEQAVATLDKALEVSPDDPELLQQAGEALLAVGRPTDAAARLRESVKVAPERTFAWQSLAQALEAAGRQEEALDAYREAVARDPWEPVAHFRLGNALLARGAMEEAGAEFRRTVELDGSIASARIGLAQVMAGSGNVAGALEQLELALEFEPENPQARQLLDRLR